MTKRDNAKFQTVLGKTIKRLRKQKGLKFTIFCYENDIPKTNLYMLESGKTNPSAATLFKILKSMDVSFEEFGAELEKALPADFYKVD